MSNQNITITVSLPSAEPKPKAEPMGERVEMARPLEPFSENYYLPPPQTQKALQLARQIGVSIESSSPISIVISSPPLSSSPAPHLPSSHPPPIHRPQSPPPLNIQKPLPSPLARAGPESPEEKFRDDLYRFINHCYHELDILEGRRALIKLYQDEHAYEQMSEKYYRMWHIWEESRKLLDLLNSK